jgi:hypothetical protein
MCRRFIKLGRNHARHWLFFVTFVSFCGQFPCVHLHSLASWIKGPSLIERIETEGNEVNEDGQEKMDKTAYAKEKRNY